MARPCVPPLCAQLSVSQAACLGVLWTSARGGLPTASAPQVCPQDTELVDDSARGAFELCIGGPSSPRCVSCDAHPSHLYDTRTAASSPLQAGAPSCPTRGTTSLAATAPWPPRLDGSLPDILLDDVAAAEVDCDAPLATLERLRPATEGSEDGGAEVGMIAVPPDIISCLLKRLERVERGMPGMAPLVHALEREVWACCEAYLHEFHFAWCMLHASCKAASLRCPLSPRTARHVHCQSITSGNRYES